MKKENERNETSTRRTTDACDICDTCPLSVIQIDPNVVYTGTGIAKQGRSCVFFFALQRTTKTNHEQKRFSVCLVVFCVAKRRGLVVGI